MNFNEIVTQKVFFKNLFEAKNSRFTLWNKVSSVLDKIQEQLFDDLNLEQNIFIINDFMDKNIYSLNKVDIIIELTKQQFEYIAENKIIQQYTSDDINYHLYILDEDIYYNFNGSFFKKENLKLYIKKNINE